MIKMRQKAQIIATLIHENDLYEMSPMLNGLCFDVLKA